MPNRRTLIIASILVAGLASFLIGMRYVREAVHRRTAPVTDVGQYSSLVAKWKPTGLVAQFPATIPATAHDVRFSALPSALQGDLWIQLHLKLPPGEVAAIAASARAKAGRIYPGGGDAMDHVNADAAHGWPTATFHTAADPSQFTFPTTYTFYVAKAVDRGMGTWDPCDVCGIAISTETNEVVYWADWSGVPPATTARSRPSPARATTTLPGTSVPATMPDAGKAGTAAGYARVPTDAPNAARRSPP